MCDSPIQVLSQPTKRTKKNTSAYYQCLLTESLKGLKQPITKLCRHCKTNSANLANQRDQEITNLLTAYQQIGEALHNLLIPVNHD